MGILRTELKKVHTKRKDFSTRIIQPLRSFLQLTFGKFQALCHLRYGRTNQRIAKSKRHDLSHVFPIGMRVFTARLRPNVIDVATVVFQIQERTWT